jgi:predicted secreted protein
MKEKTGIIALIVILILCVIPGVSAGDIASFVNLGFSENSIYYMFAYYGVNEQSSPYASTFIVNVPANSYAPDGVEEAVYEEPVQPGQVGLGALFNLYKKIDGKVDEYRIDHLRTGRILYILLNGEEPKSHLEFRDFNTGNKYNVTLVQSQQGTGDNVRASFFIDLTVTFESGESKHFTVGRPDYKRSGVKQYRIKEVITSPDETSLVFVIEKEELDTNGVDIRYMVETVRIE